MNTFSIVDAADQQFGTIINGRRIVAGVDLLEAFSKSFFRRFGFDIGALFAVPVKAGSIPDRQSLPNGTIKLLHFSTEEIESVKGS